VNVSTILNRYDPIDILEWEYENVSIQLHKDANNREVLVRTSYCEVCRTKLRIEVHEVTPTPTQALDSEVVAESCVCDELEEYLDEQ
jgi:hypothetical protein